MNIYNYDAFTGCWLVISIADANPLDNDNPLLPTYATTTPPPALGAFECARYLTRTGHVPAHHADGEWQVQPDWRDAMLWSTDDGREVAITEPNVTPAQIEATVVPYPGPGYVWRDDQWTADPDLQYLLAEQDAEQELAIRQAKARAEIVRIQPAVEGGYAKPRDSALLPQLQRYLYELPDVREQAGWPTSISWPEMPQ